MGKRNKNLLIIFMMLLVVNVLFALIGGEKGGVSFDENKFILSDTSAVKFVKIGNDIELKKTGADWMLNDEFGVDPYFKRLLFSILQRVKVKKPVDIDQEEGQLVQVGGEMPMTFSVWGNATKTKTYFALEGDDQVYEVHIPGYNDYLGGIFELTPDQWRDRLLVNASWRTIQHLTLDYQDSDEIDLDIAFNDDFFHVKDVAPIDSNAVVEYLNLFQYFQANEWLSAGRFPRYDSLSKMPPLATLTIETIDREMPFILDIFPKLEGERFNIGMTVGESLLVIDENRMRGILKRREDFLLKEE